MENGIITPITLRKTGDTYQIIAGERRWRAARIAGLAEVPAVIMEADDRKTMELALIENLQRQDLDFIEEAKGISGLMTQWSMSQEQVARLLGKSRNRDEREYNTQDISNHIND